MQGGLCIKQREEGQAIVLAALVMVVLVGLAGLAVDGSMAYDQRRQAANSADAAALEAARVLSGIRANGGDSSTVLAAIQDTFTDHEIASALNLTWRADYTDSAGAVLSEIVSGAPPTTARGVRVELNYRFETFLMPVFGQDTLPAAADATAIYGPLAGPPFGGDLLPMTLSYATALDMQNNPGDLAIYGTESGTYKGSPGAFGAVQLIPNQNPSNPTGNYGDCTGGMINSTTTAPNNPNYWWCNGTPHDISVGDLLYNDPGNISSLGSAVEYRINNRPTGLVPIFDIGTDVGGNTTYRIIGFMAVELVDYQLTGNPADRFVSARYVDFFVTTGAINPDPNALDTGVYAINLID